MYIFILKNTKLCVELVKNLSENGGRERERRCVREREKQKLLLNNIEREKNDRERVTMIERDRQRLRKTSRQSKNIEEK